MTIKKKNDNTQFKNTFFLIGLNIALFLSLFVLNWESTLNSSAFEKELEKVKSPFGPTVFPIPESSKILKNPSPSDELINELLPPDIIKGSEDPNRGMKKAIGKFSPLMVSGMDGLKEEITLEKLEPKKDSIYDDVEPSFKLGEPDVYLKQNIRIPQNAIILGISGRVMIEFIVEADGQIRYVKAIAPANRQLGYGIEEACIQAVLGTSKMWVPAEKDGVKVRSRVRAPIEVDNSSF